MKDEGFRLEELLERQRQSGRTYLEFLRVPTISAGLYVLEGGANDPQTPHAEDELYVVLAGSGHLGIDQVDRAVHAGDVLFVPAHVPHRFHSIQERLEVLVIFTPAESAPATSRDSTTASLG